MSHRGRIQNGVVVFDQLAPFPEGAIVSVVQLNGAAQHASETSWEEDLLDLAGKAHGLPADMAANHDHYLYGTPRK